MAVQAFSPRRTRARASQSVVVSALVLFPALAICLLLSAPVVLGQNADAFTGEALGIMGPRGCDDSERQLRLVHTAPAKEHPIGDAATRLAAALNRALDGRLCVKVLAPGEIAPDGSLIDAVLQGRAEMAAPRISRFHRYSDSFELFDLPFLFDDALAAEWFQNSGPGQRLLRELNGTGFKGLAYWNVGLRHFAGVRALLTPEDGRGLRVRVREGKVIPRLLKSAGAVPVPVRDDKIDDFVQAKKIDALADSWSAIYSRQLYKPFTELTETGHSVLTHILVISDAAYKDLPLRDRIDLKQIVVRETIRANENSRRLAARNRSALLRAGISIRKPTPAQRAAWQKIGREAWKRFGPVVGQDYVDAALAAKR